MVGDVDGAKTRVRAAFNGSVDEVDKAFQIAKVGREVGRLKWTSDDLLEELCKSSRFTENPELALHYYHGLSCDHNAWLYNNETLEDDGVVDRIHAALEAPIGKDEAVELHEKMQTKDCRICACASCNERLVPHWGDKIFCHDIAKVHSQFNYTEAETRALDESDALVKEHKMVLEHEGTYMHLNPELVHGGKVYLCEKCERTPRGPATSVFSIANGYDPGIYRTLTRDLKDTTKSVIAAVRGFKSAQLSVRDKLKKGHVILYPSDAPPQVAVELPWRDNVLPEVVFYGTPVQWAAAKGNFTRQTTMGPIEVYMYLRVLKRVHVDYKLLPLRNEAEAAKDMALLELSVIFPPEQVLRSTGDLEDTDGREKESQTSNCEESGHVFDVQHSAMLKPPGTEGTMADVMGASVKNTKPSGDQNPLSNFVKNREAEEAKSAILKAQHLSFRLILFLLRRCKTRSRPKAN